MWYDPLERWIPGVPRWWRVLVTGIVAAIVCIGLFSLFGCTPDARAATLDDLAIEMLEDSVRVTVGHTVDARADSATVKVTIGSASQTRRASQLTGSAVFTFAAPAEGATVTISAQVCAYRAPLAPQCVGKNRSWTRPVGPLDPPVIDTIDVGEVAAAIGRAPVLDSVQIVRVTGATCDIERRDYYGFELLIVLDSAAEAAGCEVGVLRQVYSGTLHPSLVMHNGRRVRRADSLYAGLWPRLQARWDSMMTGLLPPDNRWCALCAQDSAVVEVARSPDTTVAAGGQLLAIADYRASHAGFTWP